MEATKAILVIGLLVIVLGGVSRFLAKVAIKTAGNIPSDRTLWLTALLFLTGGVVTVGAAIIGLPALVALPLTLLGQVLASFLYTLRYRDWLQPEAPPSARGLGRHRSPIRSPEHAEEGSLGHSSDDKIPSSPADAANFHAASIGVADGGPPGHPAETEAHPTRHRHDPELTQIDPVEGDREHLMRTSALEDVIRRGPDEVYKDVIRLEAAKLRVPLVESHENGNVMLVVPETTDAASEKEGTTSARTDGRVRRWFWPTMDSVESAKRAVRRGAWCSVLIPPYQRHSRLCSRASMAPSFFLSQSSLLS